MKISVELSEEQAERLQKAAQRLGVDPEDLVSASVSDLLGYPDEDFQQAAEHVLQKNSDLYRRLR